MGIFAKMWSLVTKATEGQYRAGPYNLPVSGGWLSAEAGKWWNWWQLGYDVLARSSQSAMVEACVSAYAQTVSMCPGDHWRLREDGGRDRVTNSALSRILRHPNDYQSISDFMLNATRSLYLDGNCYALALRNDRFEIDELHLMDPGQCRPQVSTTGEVFYQLGGNSIIDNRRRAIEGNDYYGPLVVPRRDVLHIRLHCYERTVWPYPLVGQTPLAAAESDLAYYAKMRNQQDEFLANRASPSAVLTTDLNLNPDQVAALRDRWNDQSKGLHAGGVPILTHGLKVQPWTTPSPAKDMQLAELLQMTDNHIALVFRVPLAVLGVERASSGSTEQLYASWLASGLGFALSHIEESFGLLFNLKGQPDEYVEFDTSALLRSAQKDRIEMLVRGVQGGVFSPNEARAREDLPAVEWGGEPRVQQQVVPLSAAGAIQKPGPAPAAPSAPPAPPAPPQPGPPLRPAGSSPTAEKVIVVVDRPKNVGRQKSDLLRRAARFDRDVA